MLEESRSLENNKIKMLKTVRSDVQFAYSDPGTVLWEGSIYRAVANRNGAVCGICDNLQKLGVKPGEFVFVEAPEWLKNIWKPYILQQARRMTE